MVLRPVFDPSANMAGYPSPGAPPSYTYSESAQHPTAPQWQAYPPPQAGPPYPPQHSPYASPAPGGQSYGGPQGPPRPPPSPHGSDYYSPGQPQYAGSPSPAGQYPPPGYGPHGQSAQQPYYTPQQQAPYQPPSQPQYTHSPQPQHASPGYPPQIKQEYAPPVTANHLPQTEEERGLLGALAGGAAGAFAGHKVNHGFLGALGGAFAGHKLQDAYKDHKKHSRPGSRRSSSSSSSDDGKHGCKPPKHYAAAPPPPPVVHGTRGNFFQSSARISLDNDYDLIAECGAIDGSRKLSSIALNRLLTNDDGHFRWAREGNFAASARNVRLAYGGRFLQAELRRCDGSWRSDEICLDERIENSNGNLQMLW